MTPSPPIEHADVASAYDAMPPAPRRALLAARARIFALARATPRVGAITETLKWGTPAYLTSAPRSGTTLRLGLARDGRPAAFVHCQTSVIDAVAQTFPDAFDYEGTRGARFDASAIPDTPLDHLILAALTYHLKPRH